MKRTKDIKLYIDAKFQIKKVNIFLELLEFFTNTKRSNTHLRRLDDSLILIIIAATDILP